jgi:hypothetical protein
MGWCPINDITDVSDPLSQTFTDSDYGITYKRFKISEVWGSYDGEAVEVEP